MNVPKRLAVFAVALGVATTVALAPSNVQAATPKPTESAVVSLEQTGNAAVDVALDLNCITHTLTARVTNKTTATITPAVTFDELAPKYPVMPIEAGKTGYVTHNFSGNNLRVEVAVMVDTFAPVQLSPLLSCQEPLTFMVTDASQSAVAGQLTNNSSLVAQTALIRVGMGDLRIESLAPGESRLVALPFTGFPEQTVAFVSVGNTAGYEGTYSVSLDQPLLPPVEK